MVLFKKGHTKYDKECNSALFMEIIFLALNKCIATWKQYLGKYNPGNITFDIAP